MSATITVARDARLRFYVSAPTTAITETTCADSGTATITVTGADSRTVSVIRRAAQPFVPPPILRRATPPVEYPKADRSQVIRDAEAKRRRQAARQAKGMAR